MQTKRDERIDEIYQLITELASGNLTQRIEPSNKNDEIDAIIVGINMLAEELEATTVSKDYLGNIYNGVIDLLIVLNPDNSIQSVNPTTCRVLGFKEEELVGQPVNSLFFRNKTQSLQKINAELNRKGYVYNLEKVMKTKSGGLITTSTSCSLLYDNNGKVSGILYIAKDISKLKQTEEQLRSKNEELNTFIYRASHDLKGPLASMLGLVDVAKMQIDNPEAIKTFITLFEQSTNRLNTILLELLELGKITQSSIENSLIDVKEIVAEIIKGYANVPGFKKIKFDVSINHQYDIRSKKILLTVILQNLIDNAIKYKGTDNLEIDINVEQVKNKLVIRISDNGIGIDKKMHHDIFKMFFRGHYQSTGIGLGLYIVKTSVDMLKGKISVKSRVNHGSTFTVTIPVNKARLSSPVS